MGWQGQSVVGAQELFFQNASLSPAQLRRGGD
jgi:hypothetical protein